MIAVLKAPSHHLSAKANPSKDNEQLQEDSKQRMNLFTWLPV